AGIESRSRRLKPAPTLATGSFLGGFVTYYGSKEMAAAFRTVRKNTIQIAEEIPENKYDFRAAADTRTIGQTLAHIAVSATFQLHVHQNKIDSLTKVNFPELFQKVNAEEMKPRTKGEIISLLKS